MNIHLVVPSYNNPASTIGCVNSAIHESLTRPTIHLYNHWENMAGSNVCSHLAAENYQTIRLYNYRQNRGLAKTWNEGMKMAFDEGADVVVIANADIRFGPGSLKALCECAMDYRTERAVTFCSGDHGKHGARHSFGHSLFAVVPLLTETLGYFDQNFCRGRAHYEDSDMDRRRDRAGMHSADAGVLDAYHEGSESIFLADKEEEAAIREGQRLNGLYYHKKWGNNEEYPCPFNLDVPPWLTGVQQFGMDHNLALQRITWEMRENPYPGFLVPDPKPVRL